jgi:hypothetical protein
MTLLYEISSDERFASSLQYIKKRLVGEVVRCTVYNFCPRIKLTVEITDKAKLKPVLLIIADAIADIVVTDCKSHYIDSKIRLQIEDTVARHAFIRALSSFDRETDKIIAKTLLKITPSFLLDSFYDFMLDILKSRWNEVCLLANENTCYLVCQKTFFELLRFLISNIDSISDEAHVITSGGQIEIYGRGLKPIHDIYINESLPKDIQVVTKLVSIAPRKIFFHQNHTPFDVGLVSSIEKLFGSCIVVN